MRTILRTMLFCVSLGLMATATGDDQNVEAAKVAEQWMAMGDGQNLEAAKLAEQWMAMGDGQNLVEAAKLVEQWLAAGDDQNDVAMAGVVQEMAAGDDQYESFRKCLAKSKSGVDCVGELPENSEFKSILAPPADSLTTMDTFIPMASPKWVWGGLGLPGPAAAYLPTAVAYPSDPFDSQ